MTDPIGIDVIDFSVSGYYIDLKQLAEARQIPYTKYYQGIGQELMSVSPPDEDSVVLGANAAHAALQKTDKSNIDLLLFATESATDQAKSGGLFCHQLLSLPHRCRVLELKQACYAVTGALQLAVDHVRCHPDSKVLIIGADIARYPLKSTAEPTQGAGAVALVVSRNPRLMRIEPISAFYSEDVMDFWRPNNRREALVDGKLSMQTYLKVLKHTYRELVEKTQRSFHDFAAFCYHVPFAKLAQKGQEALLQINGIKEDAELERYTQLLQHALYYPKIIGNSYTASMYISLISLLERSTQDFSGQRLGFFSYGSGCVGEFFTGVIEPTYKEIINASAHQSLLAKRQALTYTEYESFLSYELPNTKQVDVPHYGTKPFRYARFESDKRIYEPSE